MELLQLVRNYYLKDRLITLDKDYLQIEEEKIFKSDLELILAACKKKIKLPNTYNSCIIYVTGLSDEFDFTLGRCLTKGGSPPDIDIDWSASGRDRAIELVTEKYGRDCVANIVTHGTLGPKSLTRRFFSIYMPENEDEQLVWKTGEREILNAIPKALFGKEATLDEIILGDAEKNYPPNKDLPTKFPNWYKFTNKLDDMVCNFGIHAGGVVISSFPIMNIIPTWSNKKSERITQFDMKEVEELGLIKFDFLVINNLDIIKECIRLIKVRHNVDIDLYNIPDGDKKAYSLLAQGLVVGVFQMETSNSAKDLLMKIKPQSIGELSDISSLNRPGCLSAGFDKQYVDNKNSQLVPKDMPEIIAELLKDTYYTLIYQEQVMKICQVIAGYSLREADDIRRAMGKKNVAILNPYEVSFKKGFVKYGLSEEDGKKWWDILVGFADYGLI